MVWRLITYTELYSPVLPYKSTYAIGIVENEFGARQVVRIDRKYFGKLKTGLTGRIENVWTVFGEVPTFIPDITLSEEKVAFITGGARGIGAATALELAKAGYSIAIGDLTLDQDAKNTLASIEKLGVKAMFVELDVTNLQSVEKAVNEVLNSLRRIDVLVNNAGITKDVYFQRMDRDVWDKVLEVNLTGVFNCTKAVVNQMIKQGGGVIINVSSIVGLLGNVGQANYAASKAGLIGLTYTLAKELAPYGIRVVAIAPGFVKTRMALAVPTSILRDYMRRIPIARLIEPEEVGKLIRHIVENEALNGVVIPIDLGLTISSPKA